MQPIALPAGARDEFGETLQKKLVITQEIINYYNEQQYQPIATSLIEQSTVFAHTPTQKMLSVLGEEVALRADMTLPVARFVRAMKLNQPTINLYYLGDVFRPTEPLSGTYNQTTQMGIELIGVADCSAEIEAIERMIETARIAGFKNVEVELSDVRLLPALLQTWQVPQYIQSDLMDAVYNKELTNFVALLDQTTLNKAIKTTFRDLPLMFRQSDQILAALPNTEPLRGIVQRLQEIKATVLADFPDAIVTYDLAAKPEQSYYTGTMFKGYTADAAGYVFSGGRYDQLLSDYKGHALPAVGAALGIDNLMNLSQSQEAEQPVTFVLAKGRVADAALPILKQAGVDVSSLDNRQRRLIFKSDNQRLAFILVKSQDVVKYLDRGIGDVGIVGSDVLEELDQLTHYNMLDLKTGQAKFILASLPSWDMSRTGRKKIATKYPQVTKRYFEAKGEDVEMIKLEGSVELAPLTGLADAIVDLTETGRTLAENHLKIFEDISAISTRLVVTPNALRQHEVAIKQLVQSLQTQLVKGEKYDD